MPDPSTCGHFDVIMVTISRPAYRSYG